MNVLSWIFFGLVVGVLAKLLMPGKDTGGFIITILLGIDLPHFSLPIVIWNLDFYTTVP